MEASAGPPEGECLGVRRTLCDLFSLSLLETLASFITLFPGWPSPAPPRAPGDVVSQRVDPLGAHIV